MKGLDVLLLEKLSKTDFSAKGDLLAGTAHSAFSLINPTENEGKPIIAKSSTATGWDFGSTNLDALSPTRNFNVVRTLTSLVGNTGFIPNATRSFFVNYAIEIICSATIGSNTNGKCELQYYNGSAWVTVDEVRNSNSVTLAIALNSITAQTASVKGDFPANTSIRLLTTVANANTTINYVRGFEILR